MTPLALALFLIWGVVLGTLVTAIWLRAGVALYNTSVGGSGAAAAIPQPDRGMAPALMFFTCMVGWFVRMVIAAGLFALGLDKKLDERETLAVLHLLSLPFTLVCLHVLLTALLPVESLKAFLVTACYAFVYVLNTVVVVLTVILLTDGVERGIDVLRKLRVIV